jgi:hypothetical protein
MFTFFTSLADVYSRILMPPKQLAERLSRDASDNAAVLDRCLRRLEWDRSQERRVTICFHALAPLSCHTGVQGKKRRG